MPTKDVEQEATGFTAEERAAMRQRAAELRAEGRKGVKRADGLQAALDAIAAMAPEDRALAERVHVVVTTTAPQLAPRTWYGMPAYADADGKVDVFFQDAAKFKARYATLGFNDTATLDDGDLWPTSFALRAWSPEVEERVVALVRAATS
ncbi:iron chaperone [Geodermatophilus sp. SYSU D00696]